MQEKTLFKRNAAINILREIKKKKKILPHETTTRYRFERGESSLKGEKKTLEAKNVVTKIKTQ